MRILVITSSFPRFQGDSSGVFILGLCKALQKLGVMVEVLAPHHEGCKRHEIWFGIPVSRFPYFYPLRLQRLCYGAGMLKNMKANPLAFAQLPFFMAAELFRALWIAERGKFDLVHAHWSIPQGVTGLVLKKFRGIPCVVSLHGSDVYALNVPFLRGLNGKVILGSDACTANSKATAERAWKITGREDIRVIPMGVDIDFFSKANERAAAAKHDAKRTKMILYAGRLIDVKGVEFLVKAMPAVLERHTKAMLQIVGSGPSKKDLVSLSEQLHLQGKVVFNDAVSQEELVRYYAMAHVFVLPSVMTDEGEAEGLGVVLLEAMASGVPVIGSAVGGIPDIIRDQETGLLVQQKDPVDLADKINRVLADKELRQHLSTGGRHFVQERFSWPFIAEKYLEVFRSAVAGVLLGGEPPPGPRQRTSRRPSRAT